MSIHFTQFMLPNGRQKSMFIDRDKDIEELAEKVINAGGRFTCEILRTGMVSIACEYNDEDICIELANNGSDVLIAVDRVIKEAAKIVL